MTNFFVILCAVGVNSPVLDLIGRLSGEYNYLKSASGKMYVAGYGPYNAPDSDAHITLTADQLPELASQIPTLGKSVAISGIDDPEAFMAQYGLVRCDSEGNDLLGERL